MELMNTGTRIPPPVQRSKSEIRRKEVAEFDGRVGYNLQPTSEGEVC